jgi:integrase/recombinase XerD
MNLETYLKRNYSPKSAVNYLADINHYLNSKTPEKAGEASYSEVLDYIGIQRKRNQSAGSLNRILQGIKKYYNYLNAIGARADHPCGSLSLKDKISPDIQLQDLFTAEELQLILTRAKESKPGRQYYRNQVILGLLVYQGLKTGELTALTIQDINLEVGTVYIKANRKSHARTLNYSHRR